MGKVSNIPWCDATFNSWWGCTPVGPGCEPCYAEEFDHRLGGDHWGVGKPRRYFGPKYWRQPDEWNRIAAMAGKRMKVFCASMADVFDNEVKQLWREKLWAKIRETPMLDWQIVTKRIGNAPKMLPSDWGGGYPNVWMISTICDQDEAERDVPKLLRVPAEIHGLSVEPMLGPVEPWTQTILDATGLGSETPSLDWVIIGGQSGRGPRIREFHLEWDRALINECITAGCAVFNKQLGSKPMYQGNIVKLKDPKGEDPEEWPADLRVRQFPVSKAA